MIKVEILQDVKWRKPGRIKEIYSHTVGDIVSVPEPLAESWLKVKKAKILKEKSKQKKNVKK